MVARYGGYSSKHDLTRLMLDRPHLVRRPKKRSYLLPKHLLVPKQSWWKPGGWRIPKD